MKKDGSTPAFIAVQQGQLGALRVLKELGANLDTPNDNGSTPALIAAQTGQVDALRVLKELGANLDTPNKKGATSAFIAVYKGDVKVLRVLKELGANLDAPKEDGATPAFYAAQIGQVEALHTLKALGANLDAPLKDGSTPTFIAVQEGQTEIVRLFIQWRVNLNVNYSSDKARLIEFSKNKSEEVQQRMQKFVDLHQNEAQISVSPLEIAQIMGHEEIASLLSVALQKMPGLPIKKQGFFPPGVLPDPTPLSAMSAATP